ncbi:MAG: thioesterase family protein [Acidobacteriota bacterium]
MFIYYSKIKLFDTDAAGVLFFGNQFRIVEEAYEAFLDKNGISISDVINKRDYLIPVVHADSDFLAPLTPGENIKVEIKLGKQGDSSFTLKHRIFKEDGTLSGEGKTIHVCVNKKDFKKISIPDEIVNILSFL